jgi:hypothetical protein
MDPVDEFLDDLLGVTAPVQRPAARPVTYGVLAGLDEARRARRARTARNAGRRAIGLTAYERANAVRAARFGEDYRPAVAASLWDDDDDPYPVIF